jgi:hypothetical protein
MMARTTEAARHPAVFAAAFGTGRVAAVEAMYEHDALLVPEPGNPVSGPARAAASERFLALGLPRPMAARTVVQPSDGTSGLRTQGGRRGSVAIPIFDGGDRSTGMAIFAV